MLQIKRQYPKIKIVISAKQIIMSPDVDVANMAIPPSSHHKNIKIAAAVRKLTFYKTLQGMTSRILDSFYKFWKS